MFTAIELTLRIRREMKPTEVKQSLELECFFKTLNSIDAMCTIDRRNFVIYLVQMQSVASNCHINGTEDAFLTSPTTFQQKWYDFCASVG